jgi:hypothetical protein
LGERVVAVIDHGCPFAHRQFLTKNQSGEWESRVRSLWDQDIAHTPPAAVTTDRWNALVSPAGDHRQSFRYGREITTAGINALIHDATMDGEIDEDRVYRKARYPVLDARKTHGAHVLDVACGKLNPLTGEPDAASDADIIFVQLPLNTVADTSGGSMTKYVLDAMHYIFDLTKNVQNLVINLSYGSTAGPHDGSSMLERAMDKLLLDERARRAGRQIEMVVPAGNHFLANGHTSFSLSAKDKPYDIRWQAMPDNQTDSFLELWYTPPDAGAVTLSVCGPCGTVGNATPAGAYTAIVNNQGRRVGAIMHASGTPNGTKPMILVALAPTHPDAWPGTQGDEDDWATAAHGVWTITVAYAGEARLDVDAWVERDDPLKGQVGQPQSYLLPNRFGRDADDADQAGDAVKRECSGNSLANGVETIVVGACVNASGRLSSYSAAGPTRNFARNKARRWPDCLAVGDESDALPGVQAAGTRSGILVRMNGSSVAAPQVARQLINAWVAKLPPGTTPPLATKTPATSGSTTIAQQRGEGAPSLRYPLP